MGVLSMSALTAQPTKVMNGEIGCHLYHLTTVNNSDTMNVRFNKVTNVFSCNRSSADVVYVTVSGTQLTFVVAGGATPTVDLKVYGKL
jgi:hypothetical protein